jgi:1-acyl-sn-glycerol-3-phosphate acyltransferase
MPFVLILRSLVFNAFFYLNLAMLMLAALPAFVLPRRVVVALAKQWGRNSLWLLRVICGLKVEYRGLDKIPPGPLLIAAKHQSTWETFALLHLFRDPTFIIKRELMWIPLFGWCSWKAGMIPVDRGAGKAALTDMAQRARAALDQGRQIVIFPEGTRRAAGAEPRYKMGIAHLYAESAVPCLPIALNSGLFWPRRKLLRYPGTIVVDILDPIPPGLDRNAFIERLQNDIERATARLVDEGRSFLASHGNLPEMMARAADE